MMSSLRPSGSHERFVQMDFTAADAPCTRGACPAGDPEPRGGKPLLSILPARSSIEPLCRLRMGVGLRVSEMRLRSETLTASGCSCASREREGQKDRYALLAPILLERRRTCWHVDLAVAALPCPFS